MLAQNFKTPADLGIKDAEFDALLKVLGMLERDELRHAARILDGRGKFNSPPPQYFNMADWHCGTAACIGGWAEAVGKLPIYSLGKATDRLPKLAELFYPDTCGPELGGASELDAIAPEQAAIALRNYLTHGEPRWEEALA